MRLVAVCILILTYDSKILNRVINNLDFFQVKMELLYFYVVIISGNNTREEWQQIINQNGAYIVSNSHCHEL